MPVRPWAQKAQFPGPVEKPRRPPPPPAPVPLTNAGPRVPAYSPSPRVLGTPTNYETYNCSGARYNCSEQGVKPPYRARYNCSEQGIKFIPCSDQTAHPGCAARPPPPLPACPRSRPFPRSRPIPIHRTFSLFYEIVHPACVPPRADPAPSTRGSSTGPSARVRPENTVGISSRIPPR